MLSSLSFTTPWLLAALFLLPLIWLLLRAVPRPPVDIAFPGTFFLRDIPDEDQKPSRTPWYVLLVRLLALACLIIGLAGPVLNRPDAGDDSGDIAVILEAGWAAAPDWKARADTLRHLATSAEDGAQLYLFVVTGETVESTGPLTPTAFLDRVAGAEPSVLLTDRRLLADEMARRLADRSGLTIHWLTDNMTRSDALSDRRLLQRLSEFGSVIAYTPKEMPPYIRDVRFDTDDIRLTVERPGASGSPLTVEAQVVGRDGRQIGTIDLAFERDSSRATGSMPLPLLLRNDVGRVQLPSVRSAGAVFLNDARNRRTIVGFPDNQGTATGTLLDGAFYVRQALDPVALFVTGSIENLTRSDATVIVLDDVGTLRPRDASALGDWVRRGGTLIRFAGPVLADNALAVSDDPEAGLLPVPLRGAGRAFGGALTWEEPQPLGGLAEGTPFARLDPDPDIRIRRQILAQPSPDVSTRSWAFLADGTPLVTAHRRGDGYIVLFHVAATPDWSDLPISGLFVDMLQQLASLSTITAPDREDSFTLAPLQWLDGFGTLNAPADDALPVTFGSEVVAPSADRRPGFYGNPVAPVAINPITKDTDYVTLEEVGALDGALRRNYIEIAPRDLSGWLIGLALTLLLIDFLMSLFLLGRLPVPVRATCIALAASLALAPADPAMAQPARPLDPEAVEATLVTRLAYIRTGDPEVDRLTEAGLAGISRYLADRSALEPGPPAGLDIESSDLSVYPLIYWPITADMARPSENALYELEQYMAGGGLVVFDTRDGDRLIGNEQTMEQRVLRDILSQLNIPPLEPLPEGHVLGRSFYLLSDLPGRNEGGTVWVEARRAADGANDSVTPVIIGGRDWAAAWALDEGGVPLRTMGGTGGNYRRGMAIRAGINMVMVALTGNYKVDQLQAEALLDKLGTEGDQ